MPFTRSISRNGIITVPLFTAPYTIPVGMGANAFRRYSWYPQVSAGVTNNNIPVNAPLITKFWGGIPGPANRLSIETLGTAASAAGPIFFGTSMDGFASINTGNVLYSFPFSATGGNQSQAQFASIGTPNLNTTPQIVGTYVPYDTSAGLDRLMPFWPIGGETIGGPSVGIAYVIPNLGSPFTGAILNRASGLVSQIDMFDPGISWNAWQNVVSYYQCPGQDGIIYGLWDTGAVSPAIPRQILSYIPLPFTGSPHGPIGNYTPVFDDPTLQTVWSNGGGAYTLDIYKGGWIVKLGTGGTGPTGQPEEIAMMDAAMTQYNLLRFVPQDAGAQTQINHASTFGWQVKIDPNGVLYFNSGNPADNAEVLYSYSPILFLYPQFSYKTGFITLPCYTPCDAVTV